MNSASQDACLAANDGEKACTASLAQLRTALAASWTAQTASPLVAWTLSGPSSGQCAVSALVLQDYCGGEAAQFGGAAINYDASTVRSRQRILHHADTRQRYELLKERVEQFLAELDGG